MASRNFSLSMAGCPLVQLEGWDTTMAQFEAALSRALGTSLPTFVGETVRHAGALVIRLAPRRFWLLSDEAALTPPIDPELGCSLSLGEGRVRFRMSGARVPDVLSACIAVDWSSPEAAPGRAVQTSFHRVPVLFLRTGTADCELIVPRSFAQSLSELINESAG